MGRCHPPILTGSLLLLGIGPHINVPEPPPSAPNFVRGFLLTRPPHETLNWISRSIAMQSRVEEYRTNAALCAMYAMAVPDSMKQFYQA